MVIFALYCASGDNPVTLELIKALSLKAISIKGEKT